MIEHIKNNSIIICNNSYKIQLLKIINKIINIKFIDMNQFLKLYYFDYDEKTILYIIKNYNVNYDTALEYLKNIYYVENTNYNISKLDFLINLKEQLVNNNLLIFNNKFRDYISNKNIIVYKYSLSKFEEYALSKFNNVTYIEKEKHNYIPKIYEFETIEEEVEYIAIQISKLVNSGIDINKIKLTNVSKDYINIVTKIFNFYNLKISKTNNVSIVSNIVGKQFINNINLGINDAIISIEQYKNTTTYNKIIDICNKYIWCDNQNDVKILIEYDLNNTYIENKKYTNTIEVVDYKNYNFNDEYVFMVGFNQGIIPEKFKDEDYIIDNIKPSYMDNTTEKNIKERENTLISIKNISNLTVTYKLKTAFNTFYKSDLIDDLDVVVEKKEIDFIESYSILSNKIKLSCLLDDLTKFNISSNTLSILNSNYNVDYNTYSNEFTGLNKQKLHDYIKNLKSFNISYSSMDNYNRCSFRFYINKILGLNEDTELFSVTLGSIYHDVLEIAFKKNIDVKKEAYNYIINKNIELTNSNKFFLDKAIDNLCFVIDIIKRQNCYSNLKNLETEKHISVNIKDNINFVGFIDKILTNDDKSIGAVIDYKTYVKKPNLKYINNGINLQLPIYMYLAKHSYKDIKFSGFYLQNILIDNKSEEDKIRSLRLIGFSNTDISILSELDNNYMDSKVIDGIKVNKDGTFNSNSLKKMMDNEKIDKVIKLTEEQINNTISNIMNSKFDINPKYDNENIGCEFCKYKDLCFMKESNFKKIRPLEEFDIEN